MGNTFLLEIVASDHPFYSGPCEMLVFRSQDGEHGILPGHETMVCALDACELRYQVDGEWNYAATSIGFVEITGDKAIVLADTVENPDEIDQKRAEEAKIRAEERLKQRQSMQEYARSKAALNRAMARLKVTERRGKRI
ncbi:MAG: ATP synthase F1 subunit epsilon [Lachnospira sp.]|nr:ATP synthase F1 subunit epsilon [Lachnospira sp.]